MSHVKGHLSKISPHAHFAGCYFRTLEWANSIESGLCSVCVVGKYREFHKLYNNNQFTEAGALLLSLLTARVAPKR